MTSVLFRIANRCYDGQMFSQRLVCWDFFVWLSQSAQSCTNVSILEWCTARMLLWFESLDCMGMCYLVFNIWHLLGCCRTFFFPLMISDLTELITSAWIFFCLFVLQISVNHPHIAIYGKRLSKAHLQFCAWGYFSSSEKLQDNVIFFENGSVPDGWYSFLWLDRVCFEQTCWIHLNEAQINSFWTL